MSDPQSELRFNPRSIGESFKQWQVFMEAVAAGKSVAYLTTHGEISSPKRTKELLTAYHKAVEEQVFVKNGTDTLTLKGWQDYYREEREALNSIAKQHGLQQHSDEQESEEKTCKCLCHTAHVQQHGNPVCNHCKKISCDREDE